MARLRFTGTCGTDGVLTCPPAEISDAEWGKYVFLRENTKGVLLERWVHTAGCRRWFNLARDTVTYEILAVYPMGAKPPKLEMKTYV